MCKIRNAWVVPAASRGWRSHTRGAEVYFAWWLKAWRCASLGKFTQHSKICVKIMTIHCFWITTPLELLKLLSTGKMENDASGWLQLTPICRSILDLSGLVTKILQQIAILQSRIAFWFCLAFLFKMIWLYIRPLPSKGQVTFFTNKMTSFIFRY